jgi:hypothetical protein
MDIDKLEKVQRKAVKMVSGLEGIEYEERCAEIGLKPLETRRKLHDLVLLHGMERRRANKAGGGNKQFEGASGDDGYKRERESCEDSTRPLPLEAIEPGLQV